MRGKHRKNRCCAHVDPWTAEELVGPDIGDPRLGTHEHRFDVFFSLLPKPGPSSSNPP